VRFRRVGVISTRKGLPLLAQRKLDCDFVEVRLDYLLAAGVPASAVQDALCATRYSVILTLRAPDEGGQVEVSDKERIEILHPLLPCTDAVDVEFAHAKPMKKMLAEASSRGVSLILSAHFFDEAQTYSALTRRLRSMAKIPATVYKLASRCDTVDEMTALLRLQSDCGHLPLAVMGMGRMANESRQLLPLLGSKLVYGYLDKPTAPGQPSSSDLSILLGQKKKIAQSSTPA